MRKDRLFRAAVLGAGVAMVALGTTAPASASSTKNHEFELRDRCDVATFNAALGEEVCAGQKRGSVTFDRFIAALDDGGHKKWNIHPHDRTIRLGDTVSAENVGGEVHSFTRVPVFGQGCVRELNEPFAGEPELCNGPVDFSSFVGPAEETAPQQLGVGVHRFQCLIHPWMRATITVEAK
ncbi:MAG TPA: hypothetical protein VFP89_07755 [Propionibacteriaceae bacterium]|nr:hypothetical protein [Propionibacteriaceae bacterium]